MHNKLSVFFFIIFQLFKNSQNSPLSFDLSPLTLDTTSNFNSIKKSEQRGLLETIDIKKTEKLRLYSIEIYLGTPGKPFKLLLDTGSLIVWVLKKGEDDDDTEKTFNPLDSTTFTSTSDSYHVTYLTGTAEGYFAKDKISVGQLSTDFFFGLTDSRTGGSMETSGIFGLGRKYSLLENTDNKNSILFTLKNNNLIEKSVFSLDLTGGEDGKLYLGDYEQSFENYSKKLPFCRLGKEEDKLIYWTCDLAYAIFGNEKVANYKDLLNNGIELREDAIFDSGSNYNFFPPRLKEQFFSLLNIHNTCSIKEDIQEGYSVIVCTEIQNIPDVYYVFNGYALSIPKEKAFLSYKGTYLYTVYFPKNFNNILFGAPFFNSYHILFDSENNYIAFKAKDSSFVRDFTNITNDDGEIWKKESYIGLWIALAVIAGFVILFVSAFIYVRNRNRALTSTTLVSDIEGLGARQISQPKVVEKTEEDKKV